MSTKQRILSTVATLVVCGAGCGQPDAADRSWPDDEYAIVKQNQEASLDAGTMPIDQAMSELVTKQRSDLSPISAAPSEDLSAVSGWSFQGAVTIAPGEVTMPPECEGAAEPMACWGQKLSNTKGCMACHSVDGVKQQPCPNWKGLFGKERLLVSGETVTADEEYLTNSILNSWDQVVEGYQKTMPPYNFPEQEVAALVAYVKSLGGG
ncbi:MAG: cytochrome c [Myxococcales bacterium]|nr:cytochrome c [Myxococcales bacterium]